VLCAILPFACCARDPPPPVQLTGGSICGSVRVAIFDCQTTLPTLSSSPSNRETVRAATAARNGVPAIYFTATYFAKSGGLICYGTDFAEQFRQAAGYVDRILKGEKPADLPIQLPSKFELGREPINLPG
jgi:ABC transporter substrate binding protein